MRFKLEIDCDNDAFSPQPEPEVARILNRVAMFLYDGSGKVRDVNGNTVGRWTFDDGEGR